MERSPILSCPSFWKLLMDEDFNRGIRIPHSFSNELAGRKSPCSYWLITRDKKRSSSNRRWRAKIVKKDHYFYLCRKSWPEFVRDHELKHGDLLLFHLTGENTFWVTPYGANGSKKKLDDSDSSDTDEDSDQSETDSDVRRTPNFHRQDSEHKRKARKSDESDSGEDGADEPGDRDHRKPRPDCSKQKMKKRGGSEPMSKKARNSSSDHKDYYSTEEEESDSGEDGADEQGDRDFRKPRLGCRVLKVDAKSRKEIEEIRTAEEASKWDSYFDLAGEKPYFIKTVNQQNKNYMAIPKGFAVEKNLLEPCEVMLRCEDGDHKKSWRAKISQTKIGRVDIRDGWGDFRREYGIEIGETCRFALSTHRDVATFSVHVFGCHRISD